MPEDGFVPNWDGRQRWNIDYQWTFKSIATRRNGPPFVFTTSWTYDAERLKSRDAVKVVARSHRDANNNCAILFSSDGNVMALPETVGGPPLQPGIPYLPSHHNAQGGLVAAWPVFPLRPGTTLEFPEEGMTQTVTEDNDTFRIHVSVRHDPKSPYPVRHMHMVWRRDDPWWSTVDLRTEMSPTSGLGQYGVVGRVLEPPEVPKYPPRSAAYQ